MDDINRLLLVDDDLALCELLKTYLVNEGSAVELAHTGQQGLQAALAQPFSAVVLDIMLPELNGIEVLKRIRQQSAVPVIMLTAKGDDLDRIIGLELGADDYLPKPCNPRELVARLKAVLRRAVPATAADSDTQDLQVNELLLEPGKHQISYAEQTLALTNAEFEILSLLMQKAGKVVSKELLYSEALGREFTPYDRSVDMHLSNIRKKVAAHTSAEVVKNIRGIGYMLVAN